MSAGRVLDPDQPPARRMDQDHLRARASYENAKPLHRLCAAWRGAALRARLSRRRARRLRLVHRPARRRRARGRFLPDRGFLYQPPDAPFVGGHGRAALALGARRRPAPRAGADAGGVRARVAGVSRRCARAGRARGLRGSRARRGPAAVALRAPHPALHAAAELDLLLATFRAQRAAPPRQALAARVPLRRANACYVRKHHPTGDHTMDMNTDKLREELHAVIGDAEELLKATGGQTGERIEKVRARAEQSVRVARQRLQAAGDDVRDAARELNGRVHDNPWTAVGIAAGVGVIAGLILARK